MSTKEAELDLIVLQYLRKRKLTRAEQFFKADARLNEEEMALAARLDVNRGVYENVLLYNISEGDPQRFQEEYDRLSRWVDGSLDLYKNELGRVLYPLLAHCYLDLVAAGATQAAQELMARHRPRFAGGASGQPSKAELLRGQELQELQSVVVPQHLETNRTAATARGAKFPVQLCVYSCQLLLGFLQGADCRLLLSIVNQYLALQVTEGPPSAAVQEALLAQGSAGGAAAAEAAAANRQPLLLELLQGNVEDKYAAAQVEAEAAAVPEVDEEGKPLTKKARTALLKAAEQAKASRVKAVADRLEPEIPLPPVPEELEARLLEDCGARASLSSDALPSCAFFTFVNTARSLNCAAFAPDGAAVVGGFADSSVRVVDLQPAGKRSAAAKKAADAAQSAGHEGAVHLWGHSAAVYGLDHSPDGGLLFSASGDGTLRAWSTELCAGLAAYRGHIFPVWDVAACPAGHYFASASADRTARLWTTERPRELRIFAGHQSDVDVVRWHPNCHYLATGSADRTVRLWDVRTGKTARLLAGQGSQITSLCFTHDGKSLLSGGEDGSIWAWDLASGRAAATAGEHGGPVWALACSYGSGGLLASGGGDNTVRFWSLSAAAAPVAEGGAAAAGDQLRLLKTFRTKSTPVYALQFTPRNLLLGAGALALPRGKRP